MGFWSRVKERMKTRNPWVSGVLNFFSWGLGYLYAGRKKLVGLSLFALIWTWVLITGVVSAERAVPTQIVYPLLAGSLLFVSLALARDAYLETMKKNREVESNE